ncbi:MAG: hypothetical protein ABL933_12750 [Methyloglobulus sp.]|nr:hypothetical protein [Methyloglobulus sp.]
MKQQRMFSIVFATLLLLFAISPAKAVSGPQVVPPSAVAYGKSYPGWSAAWLQWALSIPAATNPILDTTGVNAGNGQSGNVWFLAGTSGAGEVHHVDRKVTIPEDTALFFPIVNYFWLNLPELGDPVWSVTQEAWVREDFLKPHVDTAKGLDIEIDGQSVRNLQRYRFQSNPAIKVNIPMGDIFGITLPKPDGYGLTPGLYGPVVADGYWVLLKPPSIGRHTIHFKGGFAADGFSLEVTYHITVKPKSNVRLLPHS